MKFNPKTNPVTKKYFLALPFLLSLLLNGQNFDAIINPPQAAILSIGSIKNTPVVSDEGNIVPGLIMKVGMSCDHRVIDGAVGAQYLGELKKRIENPASMLI